MAYLDPTSGGYGVCCHLGHGVLWLSWGCLGHFLCGRYGGDNHQIPGTAPVAPPCFTGVLAESVVKYKLRYFRLFMEIWSVVRVPAAANVSVDCVLVPRLKKESMVKHGGATGAVPGI